jgi:hypothetical protein
MAAQREADGKRTAEVKETAWQLRQKWEAKIRELTDARGLLQDGITQVCSGSCSMHTALPHTHSAVAPPSVASAQTPSTCAWCYACFADCHGW